MYIAALSYILCSIIFIGVDSLLFNADLLGNPPQKQLLKGVEFSRNKEVDSINDNTKTT